MKKIVELILENSAVDYITSDVIKLLLGRSDNGFYSVVKRALASGELVKVRRGLYVVGEKYRRNKISETVLSQKIYGPSYISFEFALSFHGFIPDTVQRVGAASIPRSKVFNTPVGVYDYFHIPVEPFFLGVQRHKSKSGDAYLIAGPERAICDLIYKRRLKWNGLSEITQGFRIDEDALKKLNMKLLLDIGESFTGVIVNKYINKLVKEIKNVL